MSSTGNRQLRQLGKNGPKIPALGFGAMGLSAFYKNEKSDENSREVLRKAVDVGCTMIDTSIVYGPPNGKNEILIGSLLKDAAFREKVFIATKFGMAFDETGGMVQSGKPEDVRRWCEMSLKHLQVDSIDLYYQHRVDRSIPIEETWKELAKLQKEGKVKHLGISEATSEEIRRANAVAKISALQVEFSPWTRDIKWNGILDTCRELGIAIVAYSPLGRGFLTGAIKSPSDFAPDDFRAALPRFQGEAFKENLKLVDALTELATKKGCTPGQLTLAWVIAQGDDFFAIPGTTSTKNLEENAGAFDVVLTAEDIKAIDDIIENIKTIGERYDPALKALAGF
ncbi:Aldo/keto reductase [Atractiella rhizophila]|nr:Aldo/keto reductase [Atractiella rhizophila]